MKHVIVVFTALAVVAGFGVGGWQLWDARERERALSERLADVEAQQNEFDPAADTRGEMAPGVAELAVIVDGHITALVERVAALEASNESAWPDSTTDGDVDAEIDAIWDELGDVCRRLNAVDTTTLVPC